VRNVSRRSANQFFENHPTRFSWFIRGGGKQPFEIDGRNYGHYRNEPVSHRHVKRIAEHGFSLCRIHNKKKKKKPRGLFHQIRSIAGPDLARFEGAFHSVKVPSA
jgi:hypothetical protein